MAATTCLTVSYADINDAPRNMGKVTPDNEQPKATGEVPRGSAKRKRRKSARKSKTSGFPSGRKRPVKRPKRSARIRKKVRAKIGLAVPCCAHIWS